MARINPPEVMEVYSVVTLTDYTAPILADLGTNVNLTSFCRGVPTIPETGNTADISDLSSKFNKRIAASFGGDDLTIDLYLDDTTDTAYDTLVRNFSTHIVIARYGLATPGTFAVSDEVWVYPVEVISRNLGVPGRDEPDFFTVTCAITDAPADKYSIAV